jgi:hypothetical protein
MPAKLHQYFALKKDIKETCMIEITSATEMATHSNCKIWQMGSSKAGLI